MDAKLPTPDKKKLKQAAQDALCAKPILSIKIDVLEDDDDAVEEAMEELTSKPRALTYEMDNKERAALKKENKDKFGVIKYSKTGMPILPADPEDEDD